MDIEWAFAALIPLVTFAGGLPFLLSDLRDFRKAHPGQPLIRR